MARCKNCKFFELQAKPVGKCLVFEVFTYSGLLSCASFEEKDYVKRELFESEVDTDD